MGYWATSDNDAWLFLVPPSMAQPEVLSFMSAAAWQELPSGLADEDDGVLLGILLASKAGPQAGASVSALAAADGEARRLQRVGEEQRQAEAAATATATAAATSSSSSHSTSGSAPAALDLGLIQRTAQFCHGKGGTEAIAQLRAKDSAPTVMPFLFDGQPGHAEFMGELQRLREGGK